MLSSPSVRVRRSVTRLFLIAAGVAQSAGVAEGQDPPPAARTAIAPQAIPADPAVRQDSCRRLRYYVRQNAPEQRVERPRVER
jgi:hypothetical protein